jgi:hypothetical protein
MIMWPKAKRAVSDASAAAIAAAASRRGAAAVGVFVDEDAPTIAARCRAAGVRVAQLHGDGARASLPGIPDDLQVGGLDGVEGLMGGCTVDGGGLQRASWLMQPGGALAAPPPS